MKLSHRIVLLCVPCVLIFANPASLPAAQRPNIVLVMADDMGWGQTGYYRHPVLKTPNLDAMADAGLRFDRFYAGAPNCSPTRATAMTGRSNDRTGVENHGFALRRQEKTVAQALQAAGYVTGHFGKWHLNGIRGPGVPVLSSDDHNPGEFGFDVWLSVTNFFDRNPVMSRMGTFEEFAGDSSEIVVAEALKFIRSQVRSQRPFFSVIWYGTPHSPFMASEADKDPFSGLDRNSQDHYGELVAMDRSIGTLREGLQDLDVTNETLVWFCSDNGGLPKIKPETVGGLRGFKGSVYEGGLRVPAIIEWPDGIPTARITSYPSCTMDILPTLVELCGLPETVMVEPRDGISLVPLFEEELARRDQPIPFRHTGRAALVDNNLKLITQDVTSDKYELYDLVEDPEEKTDLFSERPDVARRLQAAFETWNASVESSVDGRDYPAATVAPGEPQPRFWMEIPEYEPYFEAWKLRPEYRSRFR